MIDLYYWPTPNGWKVSILLEELGLPYTVHPVNIGKGDQFDPEFLKIAPNNRMPAIVDHAPEDGGDPISIFESAAIMTYLADKAGQLMPTDTRGRTDVNQWLYWQMGGLGPMAGQLHHFRLYAQEKIPYAIERYSNEVARLYGVMEKRLVGRDYLTGDYTIADIACFPWIARHERQKMDLNDYPNLKKWFDRIGARDAVKTGLALGEDFQSQSSMTSDAGRKILFGQSPKN
ncbi:MAG: glutathione S-transferase N-terminal domain-containing protein [Sneathiella sp.]|nr:glutathione S-transferase N-terminal domain-containing protein [Sneathiella sp.]